MTLAINSKEDEFHQRLEVALDTVVLQSPASLFWGVILLIALGGVLALVMAERAIVRKVAARNAPVELMDGAGKPLPKPGDHRNLRGDIALVFLASDTYALSVASDFDRWRDGSGTREAMRERVRQLVANTAVIVLEAKPGFARVRVVDGPENGSIGWVLPEWLE